MVAVSVQNLNELSKLMITIRKIFLTILNYERPYTMNTMKGDGSVVLLHANDRRFVDNNCDSPNF